MLYISKLIKPSLTSLPPCSLAATMTSAEGSKKFHYNIPAPLHSTCWMNTFEAEVGPYSFFIFLMYTFNCVHPAREEAVWAHFTVLGAFKCIHPACGVKWSRNIVVKLFGAFC